MTLSWFSNGLPSMPCESAGTCTVSLLMIENVSLNFDLSSNCHCRRRLGGAITRHRRRRPRAELLEDHPASIVLPRPTSSHSRKRWG